MVVPFVERNFVYGQRLFCESLRTFFDSKEFDLFICKVGQDDVQSFRNNNEWLRHHPNESLLFRNVEDVWGRIRTAYLDDFKGLVYGNLPVEEHILGTLVMIRERLAQVEWHVTVPENG